MLNRRYRNVSAEGRRESALSASEPPKVMEEVDGSMGPSCFSHVEVSEVFCVILRTVGGWCPFPLNAQAKGNHRVRHAQGSCLLLWLHCVHDTARTAACCRQPGPEGFSSAFKSSQCSETETLGYVKEGSTTVSMLPFHLFPRKVPHKSGNRTRPRYVIAWHDISRRAASQ